MSDLRRAGEDEDRLVDVRSDTEDVLNHLVDKGSLGAGDDEGTAETLEDCGLMLVRFFKCEAKGIERGDLQRSMPVAEARSLGSTVPWMAIMGIWKANPQPKPAMI